MYTIFALRTVAAACILTCLAWENADSTVPDSTLAQHVFPVTSRSSSAARGDASPVDIAVTVKGKSLRAQGAGECKHEPNASIYSAPALLWRVEYGDPKGTEIQHLSLTVWQFKNGGENQMSLALKTGTESFSIATVKGGKIVGTGSVTFQPDRSGGWFEAQGADARDATIMAKITCPSFGNIIAEGG